METLPRRTWFGALAEDDRTFRAATATGSNITLWRIIEI